MSFPIAWVPREDNATLRGDILTNSLVKVGRGVEAPEVLDRNIISKAGGTAIEIAYQLPLLLVRREMTGTHEGRYGFHRGSLRLLLN
jgi:hypothetical protein